MTTQTVSRLAIVDNSPQPTGSRDGSPDGVDLPLVDLVSQAPLQTPPQFKDWPDLHTRMQWAHDISIALDLKRRERAVLKHVVWRAGKRNDGKAPGCTESSASIGKAVDYHRAEVGQALTALVGKGLLIATRRFSACTIHRPTMSDLPDVGKPDKWMSENPSLNKKENKKAWAQEELVSGGTLFIPLNSEGEPLPYPLGLPRDGSDDDVDEPESCGMDGCPFPDRVCPMCGLGRTATGALDASAAIRASVGVDNRKPERMEE